MLALLCSVMNVPDSPVQTFFQVMTQRVLDKTLFIVWCRLKPFEAALKLSIGTWIVWFPLKSIIWRNSWNVSIKNLNFFSTEERKTWKSWMTWGWVNYQQKFFLKVNYSF